MRIGVVPALAPSKGGIYQYSITMLGALCELKDGTCGDDFVVFAEESPSPDLRSLSNHRLVFNPLLPETTPSVSQQLADMLRRFAGEGKHREAWRWLRRKFERLSPASHDPDRIRSCPAIGDYFRRHGAELMIYAWPNRLSFEAGLPYVMAIHDLQHRLQPFFPEVSENGESESREYIFRNGARYATLLLADSEVGKEDILNFYGPYGVTPDRVKILPFLPACYLSQDVPELDRQRIRAEYHLPERYLFYPAQFWPHKNHLRIVQAVNLLKHERRAICPVVFCGSHTGEIREQTFQEVMDLRAQLGLEKEIHYLGVVPDSDMSALYAEAAALVMPTFFGPTNIPVLEAWAFGCPVITSNIRGIREQVQDAGILVDPRSVESLADGIARIWTDQKLSSSLANLGRRRLASYTPSDFRERLAEILEEAKARARSDERKVSRSQKA
jgi:glycosyltransferase involved in cell wall biosynthesis